MQLNRLFLIIGLCAPSVLSAPKPLSRGTPFIQAPRESTVDWNTPRNDSTFLAKRGDVHSEEWFNSRRKVRRGDDDVVVASKRATPGNWQALTGPNRLVSYPTGVSWGGHRKDVFHHNEGDNVCSHFYFETTTWVEVDLGGSFDSSFGVSSWGTGRIDIYGKGTDGACWHNFYDSSGWSSWTSLSGNMVYEPSTVTWGSGRSDVFVISSSDGECWHRTFSGSSWGVWESIGGTVSAAPESCSWGTNHMSVFATGKDGQCWHRMWLTSQGGWSNWEALGGTIIGSVSSVAWNGNRMDIFVRGTDHHCWHRRYHGDFNRWEDWEDLGGNLAFAPNVVVFEATLEVYIVEFDGSMYRRVYAEEKWTTEWVSYGGSFGSQATSVVWGSGSSSSVDVFAMGSDRSCQRGGFS